MSKRTGFNASSASSSGSWRGGSGGNSSNSSSSSGGRSSSNNNSSNSSNSNSVYRNFQFLSDNSSNSSNSSSKGGGGRIGGGGVAGGGRGGPPPNLQVSKEAKKAAERLLSQAIDVWDKGDLDSAEKIILTALSSWPTFANGLYNLNLVRLQKLDAAADGMSMDHLAREILAIVVDLKGVIKMDTSGRGGTSGQCHRIIATTLYQNADLLGNIDCISINVRDRASLLQSSMKHCESALEILQVNPELDEIYYDLACIRQVIVSDAIRSAFAYHSFSEHSGVAELASILGVVSTEVSLAITALRAAQSTDQSSGIDIEIHQLFSEILEEFWDFLESVYSATYRRSESNGSSEVSIEIMSRSAWITSILSCPVASSGSSSLGRSNVAQTSNIAALGQVVNESVAVIKQVWSLYFDESDLENIEILLNICDLSASLLNWSFMSAAPAADQSFLENYILNIRNVHLAMLSNLASSSTDIQSVVSSTALAEDSNHSKIATFAANICSCLMDCSIAMLTFSEGNTFSSPSLSHTPAGLSSSESSTMTMGGGGSSGCGVSEDLVDPSVLFMKYLPALMQYTSSLQQICSTVFQSLDLSSSVLPTVTSIHPTRLFILSKSGVLDELYANLVHMQDDPSLVIDHAVFQLLSLVGLEVALFVWNRIDYRSIDVDAMPSSLDLESFESDLLFNLALIKWRSYVKSVAGGDEVGYEASCKMYLERYVHLHRGGSLFSLDSSQFPYKDAEASIVGQLISSFEGIEQSTSWFAELFTSNHYLAI